MGNALVLLSRPLDYGTWVGIPNLFKVPCQTVPDCARLSDQRLGRARRLISNKQVQTFPVLSAGQRNTIARQKAHKNTHKHSYNPILLRALAREGARDAAQLRRLLP